MNNAHNIGDGSARFAGFMAIVPLAALAGSAANPSYTSEQASLGRQLYASRCASCHGSELEGAAGPPLSGAFFQQHWANGVRTAHELYGTIMTRMPLQAPNSLEVQDYRAITAYILSKNHYPPGGAPLSDGNDSVVLNAIRADNPETLRAAPTAGTASLPVGPTTVTVATSVMPADAEVLYPATGDWLMFNRTYDGQRFSPLGQIARDNAASLRPVCVFQTGMTGAFQSSPVIYQGRMYFSSGFTTFAMDAKTCKELWSQEYPGDEAFRIYANRGLALYRGKIFRVTADGHMISLDAKTGILLWDALLTDKANGESLNGAPIAYDGRVFIGSAGAEWGANGRVFALDTETGRPLWTFDVIPAGRQAGAATWRAGREHGGGSMWSTLTLDPRKQQLLVSVGNPGPDFDGASRPGDNLYTNSVVALDYRTGKLQWYVQQIKHDVHDFDTVAAPVIYHQDKRKLMAVASKDGLLYVYDYDSHELLERLEISARENLEAPITAQGTHHCPGFAGGAQWHGPAYSPSEGTLMINSIHWCGTTQLAANPYARGSLYVGGVHVPDPVETARGWTRAFDAGTGKPLWARQSTTPMTGATTPTAGGVLLTGDMEGNFLVLDTKTGQELYHFPTGGVVAAGPTTYLVDGKQYVVVGSGNNSKSSAFVSRGAATIFVFALPDAKR